MLGRLSALVQSASRTYQTLLREEIEHKMKATTLPAFNAYSCCAALSGRRSSS